MVSHTLQRQKKTLILVFDTSNSINHQIPPREKSIHGCSLWKQCNILHYITAHIHVHTIIADNVMPIMVHLHPADLYVISNVDQGDTTVELALPTAAPLLDLPLMTNDPKNQIRHCRISSINAREVHYRVLDDESWYQATKLTPQGDISNLLRT